MLLFCGYSHFFFFLFQDMSKLVSCRTTNTARKRENAVPFSATARVIYVMGTELLIDASTIVLLFIISMFCLDLWLFLKLPEKLTGLKFNTAAVCV